MFMLIKSKKGIEQILTHLGGIIFSVIGFIFLIYFLYSLILIEPGNSQIAKANQESIADFVNYFNAKNNDPDQVALDCYVTLKLHHLENQQFDNLKDETEARFFYLIDSKGVYLMSMDEFDYYETDVRAFQKYIKGKLVKFDEEVKLKYEETDLGFVDKYVWEKDDLYEFEFEEDIDFLILVPSFDNQNYMIGYYIEQGDDSLEPFNDENENKDRDLIYNPSKKELFLSYSDFSKTIAKSNLCAENYLFKEELNKHLIDNPQDINYVTNNIQVRFYDKDKDVYLEEYVFRWVEGVPECYVFGEQKDCESIITYNKFLESKTWKNFHIGIGIGPYLKYEENIVPKYEVTSLGGFEIMGSGRYVLESDLFIPGNFDLEDAEEFSAEGDDSFICWWCNHDELECDEDICNEIYVYNGKAYFYIKDPFFNDVGPLRHNFFRINEYYLSKQLNGGDVYYSIGEYEIYAGNEEKLIDDKLYYFKIQEYGSKRKTYDVFLTKRQLDAAVSIGK